MSKIRKPGLNLLTLCRENCGLCFILHTLQIHWDIHTDRTYMYIHVVSVERVAQSRQAVTWRQRADDEERRQNDCSSRRLPTDHNNIIRTLLSYSRRVTVMICFLRKRWYTILGVIMYSVRSSRADTSHISPLPARAGWYGSYQPGSFLHCPVDASDWLTQHRAV